MINRVLAAVAKVLLLASLSVPAWATSYTCAAGAACSLSADIVLTGTDTVVWGANLGALFTMNANGHVIKSSGPWTGTILIRYGTVTALGTITNPAVNVVTQSGAGNSVIDHVTWDASSDIQINTSGTTAFQFTYNTVKANCVFPSVFSASITRPFLTATGNASGQNLFVGNKVYRGGITISSPNWRVGCADVPASCAEADANIFIGRRAWIRFIASGTSASVVRHNYVHQLTPINPQEWSWEQWVTTDWVPSDIKVYDNVVVNSCWLSRQNNGDIHDNLFFEGQEWHVRDGSGSFHHNIVADGKRDSNRYSDTDLGSIATAMVEVGANQTFTVYNNTFNNTRPTIGGFQHITTAQGVQVPSNGLLTWYNNVVAGANNLYAGSYRGWVGQPELPPVGDPARLTVRGDYNLYNYQDATSMNNYEISLAGTTEGTGNWAQHDISGVNNGSIGNPDPKFRGVDGAGTLPKGYTFKDSDIQAGTFTVSDVLAYYRHVYAPRATSLLIGAALGGGDIGAVSNTAPSVTITNKAPLVYAGDPQVVYATCTDLGFGVYPGCTPKRAFLKGQITDDGIQSQNPTPTWTLVSSPPTCSPASVCTTWGGGGTTAQFPFVDLRDTGAYVFQLSASDGIAAASTSTVTIVLSDHPRLFTAAQIANWKARVATADPVWTAFKAYVDSNYSTKLIPRMTITNISNASPAVVTITETVPFSGGNSPGYCWVGGGSGAWAALNTNKTAGANICTNTGTHTFTVKDHNSVNIDTSGFGAYAGQSIVIWAPNTDNAYVTSGDETNSHYGEMAQTAAVVYQSLGGDAGGATALAYCTRAITLADYVVDILNSGNFAPAFSDSGRGLAGVGATLGYTYDSCYRNMTLTEKTNLISAVNTLWQNWLSSADYIQKTANPVGNYFTTQLSGWTVMGYAIYGDDPIGATIHNFYANEFSANVVPAFAAAPNDASYGPAGMAFGGYPPEGWQYGPGMFANYGKYLSWRLLVAGDNAAADYLDRFINSWIYAMRPNKWEFIRDGESTGPYGLVNFAKLHNIIWDLDQLGRTTSANYAQWIYNHPGTNPWGGNFDPGNLEQFVWQTVGHPQTDYTLTLPTQKFSGGDMHGFYRSDWTTNAVHVSVKLNQPDANHVAQNVGNFDMMRGADNLLLTNNYWGQTAGWSENLPNQGSPGAAYSNTLSASDATGYCPSDWSAVGCGSLGGQNSSTLLGSQFNLTPFQKTDNPAYFYVAGQLWPGYAAGTAHQLNYTDRVVKSFLRTVATIDGTSWVVHDRILMRDTAVTKELHWHVRLDSNPVLSGDTVTSAIGTSKLFVKTLLPASATITVVPVPGLDRANINSGNVANRIVVVDPANTTDFTGLTVIYATATGGSLPTVSTISAGTGYTGVQISDTVPSVFILPTTAHTRTVQAAVTDYVSDTSSSVTFTSTFSQASGKHLVSGLTPGTYNVVGGSCTGVCSNIVVGGDGTLIFTGAAGTYAASAGAPAFTITTGSPLPSGTTGSPYNQTVNTANGNGNVIACSITAGSLPTNLSVAPSGTTCTITGTPTVAGTSNFTLQATDSVSHTASQAFALTINTACTNPTITTASPLPSGTQSSAYSQQFAATGDPTITWTGTGVPTGLSLAVNGLLSGTPTVSGTFTLQITATNGCGTQTGAPTAFSLTINLPPQPGTGTKLSGVVVCSGCIVN